jgi:hypothetical protein
MRLVNGHKADGIPEPAQNKFEITIIGCALNRKEKELRRLGQTLTKELKLVFG